MSLDHSGDLALLHRECVGVVTWMSAALLCWRLWQSLQKIPVKEQKEK
jgi:hypothetical protein